MDVAILGKWAEIKGIDLLGTGDFTHPLYLKSLQASLEPDSYGLFRLKSGGPVRFLLTCEVSNIYSQGGRTRKIHTVIFAPSFSVVEKINGQLSRFGNLSSDGRPILTFPARELVKLIMDISSECLLVPAHAWTPWFSLFGSESGFDSIRECFGDQSDHIYAIETGLSSDPEMNWRLSALDRITLLSNSDAHSPNKIGREANVFSCGLDYREIIDVIKTGDPSRFLFTIEFFPEEGKYHFDGHRRCKVLFSPSETRREKGVCPVCRRRLTVGVMHRVETLSDRKEGAVREKVVPSRHLIPLEEIIAEALGIGVGSQAVTTEYERLIASGGSEFSVLLDLSREELSPFASPRVIEGIMRVREGRVKIVPGYDGVYGKIEIFSDPEQRALF